MDLQYFQFREAACYLSGPYRLICMLVCCISIELCTVFECYPWVIYLRLYLTFITLTCLCRVRLTHPSLQRFVVPSLFLSRGLDNGVYRCSTGMAHLLISHHEPQRHGLNCMDMYTSSEGGTYVLSHFMVLGYFYFFIPYGYGFRVLTKGVPMLPIQLPMFMALLANDMSASWFTKRDTPRSCEYGTFDYIMNLWDIWLHHEFNLITVWVG